MCSVRLHSRTCMSQERRLYFLYLLGVEGWSLGSLRCLRRVDPGRDFGLNNCSCAFLCVSVCVCLSLGNLQQVVLVATGVLPILNLFLPSLQNRSVGLGVGRVGETGVAATEMGSAGGSLFLDTGQKLLAFK